MAGTMIYVEPIYQKSVTSAYPELKLVAVMHNDNLSYSESFDEALSGLFTGAAEGLSQGTGLSGSEANGPAGYNDS